MHRELIEALWNTTLRTCGQEGRTRVQLPTEAVINAHLTIIGNLIAAVPNASDRDRLTHDVPARIARVVSARQQRADIFVPSRNGLVI